MMGIATGFTGYFRTHCTWWERVMLIGSGLLLVDAGGVTDILGIALFLGVYLTQYLRSRKLKAAL